MHTATGMPIYTPPQNHTYLYLVSFLLHTRLLRVCTQLFRMCRSDAEYKCRRINTCPALHYMLVNLGACFSKKAPQSLTPGSYKQTMIGLEVLPSACDKGSAHVSNKEKGYKVTDVKGRVVLETR